MVLPAQPDLTTAEELLARFTGPAPVTELTLDASAVTTMTTPLALVICSALAEGHTVIAKGAPAPFIDAFSDLGLFRHMMKMEFAA